VTFSPDGKMLSGLLSSRLIMHKFHLGQAVAYRPQFIVYAPRGAYFVTAKLAERDGELAYRIRSIVEQQYERVARESELSAIIIDDTKPK
jgi:hypothetical protein